MNLCLYVVIGIVQNPFLENTTYLPLNSGNAPLYIYVLYVYVFSIYVHLISDRKLRDLPSILRETLDSTKYRRGSIRNTIRIFSVQHTHDPRTRKCRKKSIGSPNRGGGAESTYKSLTKKSFLLVGRIGGQKIPTCNDDIIIAGLENYSLWQKGSVLYE
jgi:hypothetical protein